MDRTWQPSGYGQSNRDTHMDINKCLTKQSGGSVMSAFG